MLRGAARAARAGASSRTARRWRRPLLERRAPSTSPQEAPHAAPPLPASGGPVGYGAHGLGSSLGSAGHPGAGSGGALPQQRLVAERKWRLGVSARGHPSALMAELYRALQVGTLVCASA